VAAHFPVLITTVAISAGWCCGQGRAPPWPVDNSAATGANSGTVDPHVPTRAPLPEPGAFCRSAGHARVARHSVRRGAVAAVGFLAPHRRPPARVAVGLVTDSRRAPARRPRGGESSSTRTVSGSVSPTSSCVVAAVAEYDGDHHRTDVRQWRSDHARRDRGLRRPRRSPSPSRPRRPRSPRRGPFRVRRDRHRGDHFADLITRSAISAGCGRGPGCGRRSGWRTIEGCRPRQGPPIRRPASCTVWSRPAKEPRDAGLPSDSLTCGCATTTEPSRSGWAS